MCICGQGSLGRSVKGEECFCSHFLYHSPAYWDENASSMQLSRHDQAGLPAGISTSCEGYIGLSIIQFSHPKMLWNVVDCSISSSIQYDMDFRGEANTRSKSRQCFLEFQLERVCINSMPLVPSFNVSQGVASSI